MITLYQISVSYTDADKETTYIVFDTLKAATNYMMNLMENHDGLTCGECAKFTGSNLWALESERVCYMCF